MDGTHGELAPTRAEVPVRSPPAPTRPSPQEPSPPPRRRRRLRWVLVLLLLGALGWAAWRFIGPLIAPKTAPIAASGRTGQAPQPVGDATIGRGDVRVVLNGLGTVTPLATVTVKTQINGQLVTLGFTEGQLVHKGDFLAQIDPRPYQVALETAEAQLARDQATLKGALVDLARYRKLVAQDSIATQTLDTQVATVGTDQGTVKSDQAAIDSAKLNLVYCHIVSPTDGRVGLRQVDAGNYVQTSDTSGLVVVTELQPISVVFSLPEDDIPAIMQALHAGRTLPVAAWDRADTAQLASGVLLTTDNQVDTATGTVRLRAQFANDDDALFPSQFVNAKLLLDTLRGVVTAPTAAIQRGEPGTFVYVIGADGVVHVRPVKLGPQEGSMVAVTSGLSGGERVVIDGADRLRDGAHVIVPSSGAASGGQAAAGTGQQHRRHAGAGAGGPSTP